MFAFPPLWHVFEINSNLNIPWYDIKIFKGWNVEIVQQDEGSVDWNENRFVRLLNKCDRKNWNDIIDGRDR